MVTGRARQMMAQDPRRVRIVYEKSRWNMLWDNNPRIARPEEKGDFQVLHPRTNYLRPYCAAKLERKWIWKPYRAPRGEIYFTPDELAFGYRYAKALIVEPNVKGGANSPKDWGWKRWVKLIDLLKDEGYFCIQIGRSGVPKLAGVDFLVTDSIRNAAAVIAAAKLVITPEGAMHHIAAAVGCPAVVIFGGFISPAVTGYDDQRNIYTGQGLGCGSRKPCGHCDKCMAAIKPEMVLEAAVELLEAREQ